MTIRELAATDNTALLNLDGEDIVIYDTEGNSYAAKGHYIRRGVDTDPGTGLIIQGNVSAWTVSLFDLISAGLTNVEELINSDGWQVSASDVLGDVVMCYIDKALLDRTIGQVTILGRA